jgi:nickel/cobalt exporter
MTLPAAQERSPQVNAGETGPMSAFVGGVEARFDDLIGQRHLTLGVGLLAVGLALMLGASHALLPGHGKTLMAAYIAGRQGTSRDAVVVGATVTATHTGGVLALGLALTLSTSLAGERVLGWLGLASGVLVAGMGAGLLISNLRHHGAGTALAHGHRHGYRFDHDHDHDHGHGHHGHDHHDHGHVRPVAAGAVGLLERQQLTEAFGRRQFTGVELESATPIGNVSRRGLIGMGIAGGLVPSPSALVILLSAIALGRTWFGVLLVVGYGLGMAGTLTAAGLLLVVVRDRLGARIRKSDGRMRRAARAWSRCMPYHTAALVFVVGAGLALRSVSLL